MTTLTQLWNPEGTEAVVMLDGQPAGHLEFKPPWMVHPHAGGSFEIDALPDERELALLKAFIALDEQARGVGPDHSTRQPPKWTGDARKLRDKIAEKRGEVDAEHRATLDALSEASDGELVRAASAAWIYTQAKVRMQTGKDYDQWKFEFARATAIFKNVLAKYGLNVPEPVWD